MFLFRRDLEEIARHLQSLLEDSLPERAIKASRVEEIIKDSADKVERALRNYEVWLSRLDTLIFDELSRNRER